MRFAIGIDTGGTYTDAVLLNTERKAAERVERKAKAITTHNELEVGINNSIKRLELTEQEIMRIEKVVLSTTLATNAIVEGKVSDVGLIFIGDRPRGSIAAAKIKDVEGEVNIKGRVLLDIDESQVKNVVEELIPYVDAIAVSGASSIRNPILEQKVREIVIRECDLPVVCGHEIVNELGFLERTNTATLNAGLLSIIEGFIKAINNVLVGYGIDAPVFVVKGDGSITRLESIRETPIDTALSGPAASMIGTINLTGVEDGIIADMGGTTTDMGIVRKKRVELSPDGAIVGGWKIQIKSAKLYTFGLGGDSRIWHKNGKIMIGPARVLPACRGGTDLTPTDILHYTGEFVQWDRIKAVSVVEKYANSLSLSSSDYIIDIKHNLTKMIKTHILEQVDLNLPVCAIGAPAQTWYNIVHDNYDFNLIVPAHYEVANAVGAATAGVRERIEVIVRTGESGYGYLVHAKDARTVFVDRVKAFQFAVEEAHRLAEKAITDQNLVISDMEINGEVVYNHKNELVYDVLQIDKKNFVSFIERDDTYNYVETRIQAFASGKIFID